MNSLNAHLGEEWLGYLFVLILALLYITVELFLMHFGAKPKKKVDHSYDPILTKD
jgi:hypothetical protein